MATHFDWNKYTWPVIQSYLNRDDGKHLVHHQIHSYNEFIQKILPNIIASYNPMTLPYQINETTGISRYEVRIDLENPTMTTAMIHENDGSMNVMMPIGETWRSSHGTGVRHSERLLGSENQKAT